MRRTDRLFELIQLFRDGRLWRGADLAQRLEVSVRTIYRDIDTLVASGVPIEGERGVGYILRAPIFLPPLTLTALELEALHLGTEIVRQATDPDLAEAAKSLRDKVDAVLPDDRRTADPMLRTAVMLPPEVSALPQMSLLRSAIQDRHVLTIRYVRLDDMPTERRIRPLHLEYWGRVWTCSAWCELRGDFRVFRVDRIDAAAIAGTFRNEPGKTLADLARRREQEHGPEFDPRRGPPA